MKIKQWIGVLLCTLLCIAMLPTMAFAEEPTANVWDGSSVATAYESGDGTEANPYEIATAEQFAYFAEQIKAGAGGVDAYYILTSDLDMTAGNWYPIGCTWSEYGSGQSFSGNLNGNGHCVTYEIDVPFNSVADSYYKNCGIGLFGISEATITNLQVDGTITMSTRDNLSYYGGICGLYAGTMESCFSDVDITITEDAESNYSEIGGLVGEIQGGTVRNCAFTGQIHYAAPKYGVYIGGISGYIRSGSIVACKNEGNLSGSERSAIGGIVGTGWSDGADVMLIQDCYNMGDITQTSNNPVYNNYAGGIAGHMMMENTSSAQLIGCYSGGTITASDAVDFAAICPNLSPNGTAGASYTVENCYYLTGTDDNGIPATSLNEIYEKLSESTEGVWIQDANGVPRLYWELTVNPVPEAAFAATSDNSGTLSGVDTSMKYSVDGGNTWNDITGSTMEITGVTADNDVKVYRPGNGTDILDSEIQTIDVTQAVQPTVSGVDCTTSQQNDGQIIGIDTTMEYKPSASSEWTEITDTSVTGLASGTYDVRVKANGTVLASAATTVTIGEHTCVAQEGWSSDETSHWNTCECGALLNKSSHTFKWIIDKEATSNEKGSKHEECEICGFKKASVEIPATETKPNDKTDNNSNNGNTTKPSSTNKTSKAKTNSPKTGDNTNLSLYTSLLTISGLFIAILAILRKKKAFRHK